MKRFLQKKAAAFRLTNILLINIHCIPEYNYSRPQIELEKKGMGAFFSIWKEFASATALSSFMVRKIRCHTHLSQGAPHLNQNLLTLHVLIFAVWFGVHLRLSAAQSSYGFKALHCLLNHNTNCPSSGLNKRFFFFFLCLQLVKSSWSVCEALCTWSSGQVCLCRDYPSKWKAKVTQCLLQTVIDDSAVS